MLPKAPNIILFFFNLVGNLDRKPHPPIKSHGTGYQKNHLTLTPIWGVRLLKVSEKFVREKRL